MARIVEAARALTHASHIDHIRRTRSVDRDIEPPYRSPDAAHRAVPAASRGVRMRRVRLIVTVGTLIVVGAACIPKAPPAPAPYLDVVYSASVTPKAQPVTWGAAPPIDAAYGGTV